MEEASVPFSAFPRCAGADDHARKKRMGQQKREDQSFNPPQIVVPLESQTNQSEDPEDPVVEEDQVGENPTPDPRLGVLNRTTSF
ncbi:hypothetical protein JYU34_015198 [Plutella xylostella]|uniref:Uncharacterized protein n=1 Tax=Plutella xylostella TaxID=51655 RepID=A0ABQ7Q6K4_PLUXY|nr:hypothetical protein JYU34_015198 [Plutella xylostella]